MQVDRATAVTLSERGNGRGHCAASCMVGVSGDGAAVAPGGMGGGAS